MCTLLRIAGEFSLLCGAPFQYTLQAVNGNRHEHGNDDEHNEHDDHDNHLYTRMKDYDNIVYIARLQNKFKLADAFDVKWGISGLTGKFEAEDKAPRYWLSGGDLTLTWIPFDERYKRIRSQTGILTAGAG